MWFGHILLPILIYLLTNKTLNIYALIFGSLLLNLDTIPPTLKLVSKEFHMGIIHTPFFIILTSIPVFLYNLVLGLSLLLGGLSHVLADTGTDTGIMLFYPVSKKYFTFSLWVNTGMNSKKQEYQGIFEDLKGYYSQKIPVASELLLLFVMIISLILLK